ncbi:MAG: hypothetical protein C4304_02810 [candidate division GAL15 bacterium]
MKHVRTASRRGIRALREESGVALVVALLTVVVVVLLTAALVVASLSETFNAQLAEDSGRAFLVADAAAARAIASLRLDPDWSDNDGTVGRQDCQGYVYDLLLNECMQDKAYPRAGAAVVSPAPSPSPSPGASDAKCAAVPVSPPVGSPSPSPLPQEQSFGRYTVSVVGTRERGKVTLRAIGRVGRATRGFTFTVQRVTPADFVSYSALRVDATRVGNGTFRIHGSVYVRGNWEFHGNSRQLNDRPVSSTDTPPYDNQTFVCGDLVLTGNPQIGEPSRPMLGVHIAGTLRPRGGAYAIYALLQDKTVPDIQLPSIPHAVACIRGRQDPSLSPPVNRAYCEANFQGFWDGYTNELDLSASPAKLVLLNRRGDTWTEARGTDLVLGDTEWRIPKRGKGVACQQAGGLNDVLANCAAYYVPPDRRGSGFLYVAAEQRIYIPGALKVQRDVDYRVENDPSQPCNPSGGQQDPCRPGDASLLVVACEPGTACNPVAASAAYGFDVQEMLRAHRYASNGPFYPETTFPARDLLAVLVNGRVRFGLSGNPEDQEINLVVVSGCDRALPVERCDLTMQKNLQLYGAVISRLLVFEQNVDLFQVPNLRQYLPFALDRFLSAPGGAAVVVTSWREIGF